MALNSNLLNKIRYTIYTPFYDFIVKYFADSRKKSIESLNIKKNSKILIIGAGTGLDLEYLPKDCLIVATDITPTMVSKIVKRNKLLNLNVQAIVMDGHKLDFQDSSFDYVILHLILAVIPDPIKCIKETERVLKQNGQVVVFDKFVRKNQKVSILRRFANIFTNFVFSDITRDFESIIKNTKFVVESDKDANFNGNFRLIRLKK